jgi:hypothetical protein
MPPRPAQPGRRASGWHAQQSRQRRGRRQQGLLELIRQNDGLFRGEILERMGLKGDKASEMSVSNALSAEAAGPELPLGATEGNQIHEAGGEMAQDR